MFCFKPKYPYICIAFRLNIRGNNYPLFLNRKQCQEFISHITFQKNNNDL